MTKHKQIYDSPINPNRKFILELERREGSDDIFLQTPWGNRYAMGTYPRSDSDSKMDEYGNKLSQGYRPMHQPDGEVCLVDPKSFSIRDRLKFLLSELDDWSSEDSYGFPNDIVQGMVDQANNCIYYLEEFFPEVNET